MSVILGVTAGGLFAAKSMSIKFADAATGAATGAARGFGRWATTKGAGFAARTAAKAMQPPGTAQKPTGWRRYNPFSWAAYGTTRAAQATIGRVAQSTSAGRRAAANLQAFGERAKASPGLLGSMWGGMKSGSGLFKQKKKVKGKTATGEWAEVEIEAEEEQKGGTSTPPPARAPKKKAPLIETPSGETGGKPRVRKVYDEKGRDWITPEKFEERQRARKEFEQLFKSDSKNKGPETPPPGSSPTIKTT